MTKRSLGLPLALAAALCLLHLRVAAGAAGASAAPSTLAQLNTTGASLPASCRNEWQVVFCRDIPTSETAQLKDCCAAHENTAQRFAAAAQQAPNVPRPDLEAGPKGLAYDWQYKRCTKLRYAEVPAFTQDEYGVTRARIESQPVPDLTPDQIRAVKRAALAQAPPAIAANISALLARADAARGPAGRFSGLRHPAGYAGAGELAIATARLAAGLPLQAAAIDSLVTGRGVPPGYVRSGWAPPVDTRPDGAGYNGPMPIERMLTDWGGWHKSASSPCPPNYPDGAPREHCGHYSFVEIDAATAYRSALAYVASGDERYARQAVRAVTAWAETNKVFGLSDRNGPLEAAWGISAMARAMDLLKASWPGFKRADLDTFLSWVNKVMLPEMDYYVNELNPGLLNGHAKDTITYGNWPATMADAWMTVGVLADDRARYDRGVALHKAVVEGYFKWGRGRWARGRIIGETTETLRDVYHTLFGLGSLVQAAETAWGQDLDLYAENKYALAAGLELHARIINAFEAGDEGALPPGFKFFENMPRAPEGCSWSWDINSQKWSAYERDGGGHCGDLKDGWKYLLGIKYLPTGFEIGYNHYVGRLGMRMPETAALLKRHPVDWYVFCWGLATLTHADTARELWQAGVTPEALCLAGRGPRGPSPRDPKPPKPRKVKGTV